MISVLRWADRAKHAATFEAMFEDRKRLFVDLLGWQIPIVDDRLEIDTYDNGDSVYIVSTDAGGGHDGSLRLLPTRLPHLLGDLFPQLCPFGVPQCASTWEITRLCLPSRLGAAQRLAVRHRLISALADHALETGIRRLTGVVSARFRREVLAMGWRAEPLGPELAVQGSAVGAFMIHVTPDLCERLRWTGIYSSESVAAASEAA